MSAAKKPQARRRAKAESNGSFPPGQIGAFRNGVLEYDVTNAPDADDPATYPIIKDARPVEESDYNWTIYSADELGQFPSVRWLIPHWLGEEQFTGLYGEGGTFKSFIALEWGLRLASEGRVVVYVVAEGITGLKSRVAAWMVENKIPSLPSFFAVKESVPIEEPGSVAAWRAEIEKQLIARGFNDGPDLVVIDTLARNFTGDESNPKEMGQFVEGVEEIRKVLHTAVLVIHHTPVGNKTRERGSAAFRASTFGMVRAYRKKGETPDNTPLSVWLKMDRSKEDEPPHEVQIDFKWVRLPAVFDMNEYADGRPPGSLVMTEPFPPARPHTGEEGDSAVQVCGTKADRKAVNSAVQFGGADLATEDLMECWELTRNGAQKKRKSLVEKGFMAGTGESKEARYRVTKAGRELVEKS
ncbi:MAG: ATP-binding protein [Solirubrobacterales bacterium]